ncbi:MAG: DUF417 family protein [Acidimicrobiia bacterium]
MWIGCLKFTAYEAKNIEGLIANSPFFSWAYHAMGLQGASNMIGLIESRSGCSSPRGRSGPRCL